MNQYDNYVVKDFIGIFNNALSEKFCLEMIDNYKKVEELNGTLNRQQLTRDMLKVDVDNNLLFTDWEFQDNSLSYVMSNLTKEFVDRAWDCYQIYTNKYGVISSLGKHLFYNNIKVQKTLPTEGYHVWHCEHFTRDTGSRLLLVLAYLNTVDEGGETEFLYQSLRVKPKQGTIIICPASFTHTHRGNPPLSGVKYVMNGWIEFT